MQISDTRIEDIVTLTHIKKSSLKTVLLMNPEGKITAITPELVMSKIYLIRNMKVMLDRDLAQLYGVETKRLKEAVKRNIERFPEDFMFELNDEEHNNLRSQIATSSWGGA